MPPPTHAAPTNSPASNDSAPPPAERTVIFLVAAVQFVNVLDFMMVMPMGPDFARALAIPSSHIGLIGGAYTAAAAVAGLVGSLFLDRFDRRKALAVSMLGLVIATALGGFAQGLGTLVGARILAGVFGGPATSLALSIVADVVPPQRRGRAMGAVMGAFAVASVLGVPLGLELASRGGFRLPFFAVAALGAVITLLAIARLPSMRGHLHKKGDGFHAASPLELAKNPTVIASYVAIAMMMMSGFVLIPNISSYLQENLHYPREHLGRLYLVGGVLSFVVLRIVGRVVDRFGSAIVAAFGATLFGVTCYLFFVVATPPLPIMVLFVMFMLCGSVRSIPISALSSRIPAPRERAAYMSIQSSVQHLASATGAFLSSKLLEERADRSLVGMSRLAVLAIVVGALLVPFVAYVEARVRAKEKRRDGDEGVRVAETVAAPEG